MVELKDFVGKALAERRRAAGLSQEKLAFASKLHTTYISQLERGVKMPTLATIFKVCKAMGVKPSELVKDVEEAWVAK